MQHLTPLYKRTPYETLPALLIDAVRRFGDQAAFRWDDPAADEQCFRYRDLGSMAASLAAHFAACGRRREHIAILGRNTPQWVAAWFAAVTSDNVAVPLDKGLPEGELADSLRRGRCTVLVYERRYAGMLASVRRHGPLPVTEWICMDEITPEAGSDDGTDILQQLPAPAPQDPAVLLFTSGTTSRSKAVLLSHRNLCSNVYAYTSCTRLHPQDTVLAILPFHHTFGAMAGMLSVIACGACSVFHPGLRYIRRALSRWQVTIFMSVPLLIEKLCSSIKKELAEDASQTPRAALGGALRMVVCGASPFDPETARWLQAAGILPAQVYGLTEASPALTIETEREHRIGSVGKPVPGVDLAIDRPNAQGIGEIIASGPNIMLGYYEDPHATAAALAGGWFHTGDLGSIDADGYLYLHGRIKNVIVLKSGKNVYPEELEALVQQLPYVEECLVSGVPRRGKDTSDPVLSLRLVYDPACREARLSADAFRALAEADIDRLNRQLPSYKKIQRLVLTDQPLERTGTKKIKRTACYL